MTSRRLPSARATLALAAAVVCLTLAACSSATSSSSSSIASTARSPSASPGGASDGSPSALPSGSMHFTVGVDLPSIWVTQALSDSGEGYGMSLAATSDPDLYDGHFFRLEKDGAVTDQQVITLFVTSRTNLDVTWPDGSTQPGSLLLDVDGSAQSSIDLGPGCLAYVGLDGTHADCLFYPEDDVAPAQSSDPIAIPTQDEAMSYLCSADVGELSDVTDSSSDPYSTSVLQAALTSLGYDSGPIDGRYGRTSKRAIREYQSDAGLTVDARVGPQTWASLQNAACQLPEDPARPVD